jgi:hypothetical protein
MKPPGQNKKMSYATTHRLAIILAKISIMDANGVGTHARSCYNRSRNRNDNFHIGTVLRLPGLLHIPPIDPHLESSATHSVRASEPGIW